MLRQLIDICTVVKIFNQINTINLLIAVNDKVQAFEDVDSWMVWKFSTCTWNESVQVCEKGNEKCVQCCIQGKICPKFYFCPFCPFCKRAKF